MPTVPASVLERYGAFSLYNSPYGAHDDGRAIDLYPDSEVSADPATSAVASPVAGEVVAIERVRAPSKSYAPEHDVVLAIDTGVSPAGASPASPAYVTPNGEPAIARLLHADPAVTVGDRVAVGDDLGTLLKSGFFAPWVDRHLHLEFRAPGAELRRASGSLPIDVDVSVRAVDWDGTGTVRECGETYAILDRPTHPSPGEAYAALAGDATDGSDEGNNEESDGNDEGSNEGRSTALPIDGGLPHYEFGGVLGRDVHGFDGDDATISVLGAPVGTANRVVEDGDGTHRPVSWSGPTVRANGEPIHGLSLAVRRDRLGTKLVCPNVAFEVGETVTVDVIE